MQSQQHFFRSGCGDSGSSWVRSQATEINIVHHSPSKSHVGTIVITFKNGIRQLRHEALIGLAYVTQALPAIAQNFSSQGLDLTWQIGFKQTAITSITIEECSKMFIAIIETRTMFPKRGACPIYTKRTTPGPKSRAPPAKHAMGLIGTNVFTPLVPVLSNLGGSKESVSDYGVVVCSSMSKL